MKWRRHGAGQFGGGCEIDLSGLMFTNVCDVLLKFVIFRTDFGEQMSEFQNVSDISKLLYT